MQDELACAQTFRDKLISQNTFINQLRKSNPPQNRQLIVLITKHLLNTFCGISLPARGRCGLGGSPARPPGSPRPCSAERTT